MDCFLLDNISKSIYNNEKSIQMDNTIILLDNIGDFYGKVHFKKSGKG